MKKAYETPVVEKISFDYSETVTASSFAWGGGCNNGSAPSNPSTGTKQTYSVSNEWYTCNSSLVADTPCGLELSGGKQVSNAYYDCGT